MIDNKDLPSLSRWLEKKYLEWQLENGRASLSKFSEYIGISRQVLNGYLSNRNLPSEENAAKIASKFGDKVYEVLVRPIPNPKRTKINQQFDAVPEPNKEELLNLIDQFLRNHGWEPVYKSTEDSGNEEE